MGGMATLSNVMLESSQRFNGKNYNTWKQRMLTIFEYRCLDALVLGTEVRPTVAGKDQDKYDGGNREVVMLLKLSVTDEMLSEVPSGKTAAEIWKHMKDLHETSDKSRAFFLKNMLFSMMMDEKMSLQEHLMKIKEIRDQLEAIGRKREEEDMVVITLKSLPRSYEHFIETLNITSTNVDLKFDELCNKLLQQARWRQQFGSNSDMVSAEQAFVAKDKGKGESTQQKGQRTSEEGSKKSITCHYCGKLGHIQRFCRKRLVDQKSNQEESQQQAHVAEHSEEKAKESAFYAF